MRRAAWCDGGGPASVFSALSLGEEPPESRGSAELHHSLFSDFMLWCLSLLVAQTVYGAAQNTCHPFYSLLSSRRSSRSSSHLRVVLYSSPSTMRYDHNSSRLPAPPIPPISHCLHPICFLIFRAKSQFFPACLLLIPLSSPIHLPSAPHLLLVHLPWFPLLFHHQLLHTQRRVITFVLHRVSLIGFMPPFPSTSALGEKKRLKPFVIFKP